MVGKMGASNKVGLRDSGIRENKINKGNVPCSCTFLDLGLLQVIVSSLSSWLEGL